MLDFRKLGHIPTYTTIFEESESAPDNVGMSEKDDKSLWKTVDIDDLKTDDDLETLKKDDPFLYYSIPAVRRSEFLNEDICVTKILRSGMPRHQSCPGRMEVHQPGPRSISRRTRISFECHDSLIMGNMAGFVDSVEKDDDDPILDILDIFNE
mmetsp:Transcript_26564/g.55773  ORF Transcript_26564/g.55773 Transcript_26564/m.55773 type:complete len:153 (+) Transcript_26564:139-597(+)